MIGDRGRESGCPLPLPPNRTGGFPASGFPVSGLLSEIEAPLLRLRLRRLTQVALLRHRSSASRHSSFEVSRQTLVRHACFRTLPCLASGTRGSLFCSNASLTLPPSCPPWLHGRYPLPRYYGDSDSCPAPSSTRTGLLDYRTCISEHSVSNHPMRPRSPAMLLVPGGLGLRFALGRYRRFFGLRSLLAVSSVA